MAYNHLNAIGGPATAVHVQAQQDLPVVDRILEPQTIPHFIGFALGQQSLPDGSARPSSAGTLTEDEVPLLYENYPPGSDGESISSRVMTRIGSEEDFSRLCLLGKNIQSLKSRLWEGIVPLSDQRWQEKGLHLPENFDLACQQVSAVVAVFEYLNNDQVRDHLRLTFNLIYEHWEVLDAVLNQKRAETGADPICMADLWTIYMNASYNAMTQCAHNWVTKHVDALRAPLLQGLLAHQSSTEGTGRPDQMQWKLTDGLHMLLEISVRADYNLMIPMEGYKGYTAPPNGSGPAEMYVADCAERGKVYSQRVKAVSHQIMVEKTMRRMMSGEGIRSQTSGQSYHESAMEQLEAQDRVRKELRGEPSKLQEPWITSCLANIRYEEEQGSPKNLGIAIYRLTHGQSESEWAEFVQKLEAHISDWGDGQVGSDALKAHLKLYWLDGKELGFTEDDIEAAKGHFQDMLVNGKEEDSDDETDSSETPLPLNLQRNAFLAVDSASFASYTTNTYEATSSDFLPGDFTGFVLAVDPNFDPKEGISRPDESPGYEGQMRILGSLVWGDMFALLESQSAGLEDLWPLAMNHPNQVYVGPTVPLQVYKWRAQNAIRWNFLREGLNYAKNALGW